MLLPNQQFTIMQMDAVVTNQLISTYAIGPDGQVISLKDTLTSTGIVLIGSAVGNLYTLYQNYPNPFNSSTKIKFVVPQTGYVSLRIFNTLGQMVTTLIDGSLNGGTYEVMFDSKVLPSGLYFCSFYSGIYSNVKKIVLLK